ncbi:MAG: type II toxin-antitoxin system HicB family antitoxin [Limnospira sp. PMC 1291.21]|uniref:Type II toxin-antitoxin system HicB family antitoxin n=1 Tax=Limnospira fusiformis PMC 851.14 TaxID=2219512 RepID=A0ABU9ESZ2_LIMFS|nr:MULTISPECIES: type II toxin-antitoxin system HicB family antitoxin [Limnospira]MDY7051616.1 type II toxin-antitoxin system HicB family antitoxin [Limnospira fusiformis LS22]MDT9178948.1 type II toxin-antitoxin system HicB family antitoxin [Limnospira sp. PMC 1238.20]MDT9187955.1 type II toxin-antitoxin system HicB family antitoxin [Limnospira sp. PMC 894.15]MDT9194168.1 type II toxin-antitoxin system HicB family antitoxin [Limnospira sp. PMC 1245.20]MDT9204380.1 type II toxin-antitoxin syst
MKIKAIIHPAEEGGYWAEVPAFPGCITEGDTWEEVTQNLQDAVEGWLSVANNSRKKTEPTDEIVEKQGWFLQRITGSH